MNKTLVLFLAFAIVAIVSMGVSIAAPDTNDQDSNVNSQDSIIVSSDNQNLQVQEEKSSDPGNKTVPMQKTGAPILPALLSTLMIGSGLLYSRLRK